MNKKIWIVAGVVLALCIVGSLLMYRDGQQGHDGKGGLSGVYADPAALIAGGDYKNAEYIIDGTRVKLVDGVSDVEAAPGSSSRIITRYFGNELRTDLDGDGREDVAFVLTQQTGGSGTFYYAVAALNTPNGYVGTDGYFLGDRIAPQSTNLSQNPRQKYVVVFNYADRKSTDSFAVAPSVGKSAYLKIDPAAMRWAVVAPNFEGESR